MEIILNQCQMTVIDIPGQEGMKVVRFTTQQGIVVSVPMSQEAARALATQLTTGLIVATGPIPPAPTGMNGRPN
jgi:hypothetical protein